MPVHPQSAATAQKTIKNQNASSGVWGFKGNLILFLVLLKSVLFFMIVNSGSSVVLGLSSAERCGRMFVTATAAARACVPQTRRLSVGTLSRSACQQHKKRVHAKRGFGTFAWTIHKRVKTPFVENGEKQKYMFELAHFFTPKRAHYPSTHHCTLKPLSINIRAW